jgi:integrase
MNKPSVRKLDRRHFSFMRSLAQGLDERDSWDRYLRLEGEHTDVRTVRRTITWIRDLFAAAAQREQRPGIARLVRIDPRKIGAPAELPTLEEFAAVAGMEAFSEAEQVEAYGAAYPAESDGRERAARRARLIARQLEALRWLEDLVAQAPRPADGVGAWLNPALASRLQRAGVPNLFALAERINGIGARWWLNIPGIGQGKAERVLEWMRENEATLGLRVGAHVARRRSDLTPQALALVVPAATAVVPYEKFLVPAGFDGSRGRYRAAKELCLLAADNDHAAIGAWLSSKAGASHDGEILSSTQRSYRKEAERLLLWAVLERGKALSSLNVEDVQAFVAFLKSPPAHWCGPRHRQRWSALWRPLEGPLSAAALRQSITILQGLYAFLTGQNYLVGNPFAALARPREEGRVLGSGRTLSFAQWDLIENRVRVDLVSESAAVRRCARAIAWLYATGLRRAEMTAAVCGDLEQVDVRRQDGRLTPGWLLTVRGKGGWIRQVPVPGHLVEELGAELDRTLRPDDALDARNRDVHLLAVLDDAASELTSWSTSGMYQAIKRFMASCATGLEPGDAAALRRASVHWLRHSHGSHAVNGRPGRTPVGVQIVRNNLGHASIATTSGYLSTERDQRVQAMEGFWGNTPPND